MNKRQKENIKVWIEFVFYLVANIVMLGGIGMFIYLFIEFSKLA